ncbi:MAG: DUF479 domain-containing protein [Bacteroidales bacterium]|nr:DUF479 domain-containing protein [Bacteroidales bacterium]
MNFLAHIYLSGSDSQLMVGNFIADWVKGSRLDSYPAGIRKGIVLHRQIDALTDKHQDFKKTKALFAQSHGRYAGIITDIVYDHFLSCNWYKYSNFDKTTFIRRACVYIDCYKYLFPKELLKVLPAMVYNDWLNSYGSFYGLERVLRRMSARTSMPEMTPLAIIILKENYKSIEQQFTNVFDDLIKEFLNLKVH